MQTLLTSRSSYLVEDVLSATGIKGILNTNMANAAACRHKKSNKDSAKQIVTTSTFKSCQMLRPKVSHPELW